MARRRPIRDRILAQINSVRSALRSGSAGVPAYPATMTFDAGPVERAAAQSVAAERPDLPLDDATTLAYRTVHPLPAPQTPDFYNDDHLEFVMSWVRIRDWVDYFRESPTGGSLATAAPYAEPRPLMTVGVPMGDGVDDPLWPVVSSDPRGCTVNYLDVQGVSHGMRFQRFGASRGPGKLHNGHDCIANPGDVVVAPEGGTVGKIYSFFAGTDALRLWTSTGLTLILGEIESGSPDEFGVSEGSVVSQGDPVARIGLFDVEFELPFSMLHFEMYEGHLGSSQAGVSPSVAIVRNPPSELLLNPTDYLLRAACGPPRRTLPVVPQGLGFAAPTSDELGLSAVVQDSMSEPELELLGRVLMSGDVPPGFPH